MIKIKKYILIIMIAVIFTACTPEAEPVSGAALDLQARFESMFEDAGEYAAAGGTIRYGENITQAVPATEPAVIEIAATEENAGTSVPESPQNDSEPPAETTEISEDIDIPEDEEKFVVTPTGRRYHVEGCRHAQNIHEYLTRAEAESKGYDPCRTCNP